MLIQFVRRIRNEITLPLRNLILSVLVSAPISIRALYLFLSAPDCVAIWECLKSVGVGLTPLALQPCAEFDLHVESEIKQYSYFPSGTEYRAYAMPPRSQFVFCTCFYHISLKEHPVHLRTYTNHIAHIFSHIWHSSVFVLPCLRILLVRIRQDTNRIHNTPCLSYVSIFSTSIDNSHDVDISMHPSPAR